MNSFREKKNILYIANALSNKNYIKSNIENIAEWITGEGTKLCKHNFFSEQENFSKDDFLDLYNKNKLKTIKAVIEYADKLHREYAFSPKCKPDFPEQNLRFLQELFSLNHDEKELLWDRKKNSGCRSGRSYGYVAGSLRRRF